MDLEKIYQINYQKITNKTFFDYNKVGSEGYGETGFDSIETLVKNLPEYFNQNTVFYDLGSGLGKIVYHIGVKYNVKKSCGIEYSKERFNKSIEFLNETNNVSFINDNFLNCDLSDATVIYTDNTLFPTNIDNCVYSKVPKGCVVISRKMFKESKINEELINVKFNCSTNYGTNSLYIFIKK